MAGFLLYLSPDCPRLCSVEALDLQTLEWRKLTNLPQESTPPSFTHLLVLSGQLIALCLTYSNKESKSQYCLQKIYKYDAVFEQWQSLDESLQTEQLMNTIWQCTKANGAIVSCQSHIYIMSYKGVYHVELHWIGDEIVIGEVKELHGVPGYEESGRHRQYMGLAVCQSYLYSIGGCDVLSKSEVYPVRDVFRWETNEQTWQRKADLIMARSSLATATLGELRSF